ncbi:MAG: Flp family type IVb pilin [Vulcanimicrobiaceae bacterium]
MIELIYDMLADDEGGALVEYGIIAAVAAVPMVLGLAGLVYLLDNVLQTTGSGLSNIGMNP